MRGDDGVCQTGDKLERGPAKVLIKPDGSCAQAVAQVFASSSGGGWASLSLELEEDQTKERNRITANLEPSDDGVEENDAAHDEEDVLDDAAEGQDE